MFRYLTGEIREKFAIANWPTSSAITTAALQAIKNSHRTRPLPAFDTDGLLIEPRKYIEKLRGATVLAKFSMMHYAIGERKAGQRGSARPVKDVYCFDVEYLRVIIPPAPMPVAKRKSYSLVDNFQKRPRAAW